MKRTRKFTKGYFENICYIVLVLLLLFSCFFRIFPIITAVCVWLFALFLHDESKTIGLLLFFKCFDDRLFLNNLDFFLLKYTTIVLEFIIVLTYVIKVLKKKTKINNLRVFIFIGIFLVYMMLPFHEWSWHDMLNITFFFLLICVAYQRRLDIDFKYIAWLLVSGLIISCLFGLLKNASPLLREKLPTSLSIETVRFQGLFGHPNSLTAMLLIAICSVFLLKYKGKITLHEFWLAFIPLFTFGYLAISRSFVLAMAAALIVFGLLYVLKKHVNALPMLAGLLLSICLVSLIFMNITKSYIARSNEGVFDYYDDYQGESIDADSPYSYGVLQGKSQEEIDGIFAGEISFDPGRKGLWELYLMDWSSSPKTIWLGRGISRPAIGRMVAHNLYLQLLWENGIIGYLFYCIIIASMISWKKIKPKQLKLYLATLIVIIPFLIFALIEHRTHDIVSCVTILLSFGFVECIEDESRFSNTLEKVTREQVVAKQRTKKEGE